MAKYTLRQLEYFVAVAETGTVTGAAARAHLSQSAMSTALADLERSLGVQLVMRHHARGITLTADGERLLVSARQLLAQSDDLQSLASQLGGTIAGSIAMGCFAILAPYTMPRLLTAANEALPGLEIKTSEESLDALIRGLHEGRLELALGYDLDPDPTLERELLFTVAPHVVLPVGHRLAGRKRVKLQALADEPMVMLDLPHSRDYFARLFAASGVEPAVRHSTHSAELARALVARGSAYTVLNLRAASELSLEGLPYVTVPLDVPLPRTESELRVALLRSAAARPTRRAQALAGLCREVLATSEEPNVSHN